MNLLRAAPIAVVVMVLGGCHKPVNEAAANNPQGHTSNHAEAADGVPSDTNNQVDAAESEVRQ